MDLSFLMDYFMPVIVGICLCWGYIIKQSLDCISNKYIPLIMAVLGLVLNLVNMHLNQLPFSLDVVLSGLFSGLASTGFYELLRNMIEKDMVEKGQGNEFKN